jgi:hypothetical protein
VRGGAVARVVHRRDAEVREDDAARAVQQDVAGLHIAVQDARGVGRGQCLHDLRADPGRLARVDGAALAQHVVQGRPVDQLHDDQRASVDLGDVVHGDHAGMADPRGRPCLALHPQAQVGEFGSVGVGEGAQFLDGDLTAEGLVDGPPDDAHAAPPEPAHDAITPGQQPVDPVHASALPRRHRRSVPWHNHERRTAYGAAVTTEAGANTCDRSATWRTP